MCGQHPGNLGHRRDTARITCWCHLSSHPTQLGSWPVPVVPSLVLVVVVVVCGPAVLVSVPRVIPGPSAGCGTNIKQEHSERCSQVATLDHRCQQRREQRTTTE